MIASTSLLPASCGDVRSRMPTVGPFGITVRWVPPDNQLDQHLHCMHKIRKIKLVKRRKVQSPSTTNDHETCWIHLLRAPHILTMDLQPLILNDTPFWHLRICCSGSGMIFGMQAGSKYTVPLLCPWNR